MILPEFVGFPKIYRFHRDIVITEKIDGTNAQVLVTEDGQVFAGSRKRWITVDDDNYGFAAWVLGHANELRQLGPGRHFGEWWGQGIQRRYGLDRKRFSLFNVGRWYDDSHDPGGAALNRCGLRTPAPPCCHVVPILYLGPWSIDVGDPYGEEQRAVEQTMFHLSIYGSKAAPGFMDPEGIVIFHTQSGHLYKTTFKGDDEGKKRG